MSKTKDLICFIVFENMIIILFQILRSKFGSRGIGPDHGFKKVSQQIIQSGSKKHIIFVQFGVKIIPFDWRSEAQLNLLLSIPHESLDNQKLTKMIYDWLKTGELSLFDIG